MVSFSGPEEGTPIDGDNVISASVMLLTEGVSVGSMVARSALFKEGVSVVVSEGNSVEEGTADDGDLLTAMVKLLAEGASVVVVVGMDKEELPAVGCGENVNNGYDGMGVIVGIADVVGESVVTTGATVGCTTCSHRRPVNPLVQTHPDTPPPCTTQYAPFLKRGNQHKKVGLVPPCQTNHANKSDIVV